MNESFFYDFYERIPRQGPGLNKSSKRAHDIVKGYLPEHPKILEVGCGMGQTALKLSQLTNGHLTAVDNHPVFIESLKKKVEDDYIENLTAEVADMNDLKFRDGQFDVVWAEGSIYIMGFEKGLSTLSKFVKSSGFLVVSEAVWLTDNPPLELKEYWQNEYPEIGTVEEKIEIIKKQGFKLIKNFPLPKEGWDEYLKPQEELLPQMREENKDNAEAQEVYDSIEKELKLFESNLEHFGYEFFIVKKP